MKAADTFYFLQSLRKEMLSLLPGWREFGLLAGVLAGFCVGAYLWFPQLYPGWFGLFPREAAVVVAGALLASFVAFETWQLEFRCGTWTHLRSGGHFHQTVLVKNLVALVASQLPLGLAFLSLVLLGHFDGVEPGLLLNALLFNLTVIQVSSLFALWLGQSRWSQAWGAAGGLLAVALFGGLSFAWNLPLIEARTFVVLSLLNGGLHFAVRAAAWLRR